MNTIEPTRIVGKTVKFIHESYTTTWTRSVRIVFTDGTELTVTKGPVDRDLIDKAIFALYLEGFNDEGDAVKRLLLSNFETSVSTRADRWGELLGKPGDDIALEPVDMRGTPRERDPK